LKNSIKGMELSYDPSEQGPVASSYGHGSKLWLIKRQDFPKREEISLAEWPLASKEDLLRGST
jgi:hypothetical protein